MTQPFDVGFARSHFPALAQGWALFDNAGGSVAPRNVIDRATDYLGRYMVQLGASYRASAEAGELVAQGKRSVAELLGAEPDEIAIGPSTTMNVLVLAGALASTLKAGDEIVVTNLDHEANSGAWRRLAEQRGVVIKEWHFRAESYELAPADLEPLLGPKTRLVCFTHCSNLVGTIHDVAEITRLAHAAGAEVVVDGVAFAPHRRVDVKALGVDFYLASLYKVYGPHLAALYCRRELLSDLPSQNHFFLGEQAPSDKLMPGNVNHELTAALPGLLEYLDAVHDRHFAAGAERAERLERVFGLFAEHEATLCARLLDFLKSKRRVKLIGSFNAEPGRRVPTVSFVVEGRHSREIPALVDDARVAIRFGHFYAYRAVRELGLLENDGVVRASAVHYNTLEEVERLIGALDPLL